MRKFERLQLEITQMTRQKKQATNEKENEPPGKFYSLLSLVPTLFQNPYIYRSKK